MEKFSFILIVNIQTYNHKGDDFVKEKSKQSQPVKRQTYYIKEENIEALFLWNVETREGISNLINRLIEENCPKNIINKAKENISKNQEE